MASARIARSSISDDRSLEGAAIHSANSARVTITDSEIARNRVTGFGGGIRVDRFPDSFSSATGVVTIANSTIANNIARVEGGGIEVFAGSDVFISNSTIANNGGASKRERTTLHEYRTAS